jgi:hypothetical protein
MIFFFFGMMIVRVKVNGSGMPPVADQKYVYNVIGDVKVKPQVLALSGIEGTTVVKIGVFCSLQSGLG